MKAARMIKVLSAGITLMGRPDCKESCKTLIFIDLYKWHNSRLGKPRTRKTMKKSVVIFAAVSMTVAGVTLASNVSLGKRAGAMLAEVFEFVGPMSGLINALVKPNDPPAKRAIVSFEPESPVSSTLALSNSAPRGKSASPFELPLWQSMSAANTALFNDPSRSAESGSRSKEASARESVQVLAEAPAVSPITLAANSQSGNAIQTAEKLALMDNVLKSLTGGGPASLQKTDDVWAFMTQRPTALDSSVGALAANSERASKESVGQVTIPSLAANGLSSSTTALSGSDAGQILSKSGEAAAANGSPAGTETSINQQLRTKSEIGKVPLPGTLALILMGIGAVGIGAYQRRSSAVASSRHEAPTRT
jgi:hypothetical protein